MAVPEIIAGQQAYANESIVQANVFLEGLLGLTELNDVVITGLPTPGYLSRDNSELSKALLLSLRPVAPLLEDVTGILPTLTPATFDTIPEVPVPDFVGSAPTLDIPTPPPSTLPTPPVAPSVSDPVLPSSPVITLPQSPLITGIILPEVPSITIPDFTAVAPIDDLVVPTTSFQFYEQAYESELLDEMKSKLLNDLMNGSYGIEPGDEEALYDRAREREAESANGDIEGVYMQQAARGFPLPPGDLNVALQRARQVLIGKMSSLSREIMIKRNEQFVQARQFTIEQTRGLEQILIGFHNSIMERALNAAKATLEAGIALFNASVAKFNAQQEAYRTEAQVFESRIRAALAQVEVYRTQMEGKKIESELQRNQVDLYRAQLEAVTTTVNLYKTQLEAAQIQSGIERTRIDAFRALIDAFTSQVQAKVAEFGMYDSRIRGELSKVQVFEAQANAYNSIVTGAKTKADVLIARVRAQIDQASLGLEEFKARIDAYRADLQGQSATIQARVAGYQADISAYEAAVGALGESYRLELNAQSLEDGINTRNMQISLENARLVFEGLRVLMQTKLGAGAAASSFYSAIAGGAVNSINALASLAE